MEFEWDDKKYIRNLEKHGISFRVGIQLLVSGDCFVGPSTHSELEEERFLATDLVEGQCFTVVFTTRGKKYRIISVRRSRKAERRNYERTRRKNS